MYLGYPNNIIVPIITQTAPSEQSFDLEVTDDGVFVDDIKETVSRHAFQLDQVLFELI